MFLPPGPDLAWRGNYVSLPAATLKAPVEGNRTVPVEITWLRDGTPPSFSVVFNAREQRVTPITQISAVHISNIHSAVPVRLLFPDTGFEIELGSNLEGYYPVVTNGLEFIAYTPLTPSGSDGVTIQVLNFLPPPLVFGLSPGGTVAGVSRIDTIAPLAGGPINSTGTISLQMPLAIQYGGTGAITPDLAMDALAEVSGSTVGLLARDAAGNWIMQPLSAGGPPSLPVSILEGGSGATTGFLALDNFTAAGSQVGVLQRNSGGAWSLSAVGTGTITGVVSGPGLSGGGGSGVVTVGLAIPVAVASGGTGATSRLAALDNLAAASGADTGVLIRMAGGAWGLDQGALDVGMGGTGTVTNPNDAILIGSGVAAIRASAATLTAAGTLTTPVGATFGGALVVSPLSGTSDVQIRAAAGQLSQITHYDGGVLKFTIGKTNANGFVLYDNAHATPALSIDATGLVNLGESGVAGVTVGSGTDPGPNNLAVAGTIATRGATASYLIGDQGDAGLGWEMYGSGSLAAWRYGGAAQAWLDTNANLTIIGPTAVKAGGGPWIAPSSLELKSDIAAYDRGLAAVIQLEPVQYSYNGLGGMPQGQQFVGLAAEDVAPVMPEMLVPLTLGAADKAPVSTMGVDTGPLLMALVNAVKELAAQIATLQAQGKT